MAKLTANTIVPARPMDGGEPFRVFGPDDDVPEWAGKQMGAHLFENGEHPYPDSKYPGKDDDPGAASDPDREPGAIPPMNGKGSGRDNWAAYANDVDVDIPADAGRDQIIEAIRVAGKPVEYSD
jgi:hypothetical protein